MDGNYRLSDCEIGFGHVKNYHGFPTKMCQKGILIGANGNLSLQLLVPEKWYTFQNLQNFTTKSARIFWKRSVLTVIFKKSREKNICG